jgi:hypothetical protein
MAVESDKLVWNAGRLTPGNLPRFLRLLRQLRFPLHASEVLDLRAALNEAAESYVDAPDTPAAREFREGLRLKIEDAGITATRHVDHMMRILCALRDLHYRHSLRSRDEELRLRNAIDRVQRARRRTWKDLLVFLLLTANGGAAWILLPEPNLWIKVITAACGILGATMASSLSALKREYVRLSRELVAVIDGRAPGIDWRTVIPRLGALLGYRVPQSVGLLRWDTDTDVNHNPRSMH